MGGRWRARAVVGVAAATPLLFAAGYYGVDARLREVGRDDLVQTGPADVGFLTAVLAAVAVGALLLVRRPELPVGRDFLLLGISVAVAGVLQSYGVLGVMAGQDLPADRAAATVSSVVWIAWLVLLARICLLTPTGRHLSGRWRWLGRVLVGCAALWIAADLLLPGPLEEDPFTGVDNPFGVAAAEPLCRLVRAVAAPLTSVLVVASVASLVVRFRRSRDDERRQLLWMVVAAVPLPFLLGASWWASATHQDTLLTLLTAGLLVTVPAGAALAVLRVRLYDVDRILGKAVGYAVVSVLLGAVYAVVVVLAARLAGQAVERSPLAVSLATLVAVTAARPVHAAVQDAVDRRFAQRRYDALRLVRDFVAAPEHDRVVDDVLRDALGEATAVAYRVEDRDAWVTVDGRPATAEGVPVHRAGREVARVRTDAEEPLLRAVLAEAAPELDNTGLRAAVALQLEEVRASRTRLASAQVDERRRIERDLHDGAQQRLLALAAQLQAALLNGSPDRMRAALEAGVVESRTAVVELRELANGLHPSALADGGLDAALADLASRLPVGVSSSLAGARFGTAVESAAWFIVCEAVSNAVKHADATHVRVDAEVRDRCLHLQVVDDGRGGADPRGSGLRGLSDRAEAAGGRVTVRTGPGTCVEAVLPCG